MTIESPGFFWLLLMYLVLVPVFLAEYRRTKAVLLSLGGRWLEQSAQNTFFIKWFVSSFCYFICLFLLVLAASGISWGERPIEQDRRDIDLYFVVDVSRSMYAKDGKVSTRLDRARETILRLSREIAGIRVGLSAFKGSSSLLLPMTEDLFSLENSLNYLSPDISSIPGSNVRAGLEQGVKSLSKTNNRHQVMFLISDGGEQEQDLGDLVGQIRHSGILLLVLGLGSDQASPLFLENGTAIRDRDGQQVYSKLNHDYLSKIAQNADGVYLDESTNSVDRTILDLTSGFQSRQEREGFRLEPIKRDRLFVVLALIFVIVGLVLRSIRWRQLW